MHFASLLALILSPEIYQTDDAALQTYMWQLWQVVDIHLHTTLTSAVL